MEKTPSFQVQSFGEYWLLERLAVGGMAEIFKAKQTGARGFEKIIVIKKILQHLSEDPEFVEMFEDEAKIAARLTQQNIVQIYELGEVASQLYITMEYVDGKNLRDLTRTIGGKNLHLSIEQAVFIIIEVLKGLDYAHRKTDSAGAPLDIVHRDMSPQNIIVSYEGEVKILDFGIAKAASKISRTEAGVLKGKFSYMSPEQASGRPISQTSDVYACGVILHELLTSDRLFRAKTDMETLERVKEGNAPAPSEKNDLVPTELDRISLKALAKETERRYQSAAEMMADLSRFAFEQKYTYSSQDLAAFMKSLFQDVILEENTRMQKALRMVPEVVAEPLQNAKTHVTFKRPLPGTDSAETSQKFKPDETATVDRPRFSFRDPRLKRWFIVAAGLAIAMVLLLSTQPKPPEAPADHSDTKTTPTTPEPSTPRKVTPPTQQSEPLELKLPENHKPKKQAQPYVEPVEPPSIETRYEKTDVSGRAKKPRASHSGAKAQRLGRINIEAPQEGFAKLFINGKEKGFVPGPNAREIPLAEGRHQIRCETATHVYEGSITVQADEISNIRCSELR